MDIAETENLGTVSRTTAGVHKHVTDPAAAEVLHRYIRDVHSPAIARRPGIHVYRHLSLGALRTDLLPPLAGVAFDGRGSGLLTGVGHLDYRDDAALAAFHAEPAGAAREHLLGDIRVLGGPPGRTTTYRTSPGHGHTFVDTTGDPTPQGPTGGHRYAVLLRRRGPAARFAAAVRATAAAWASVGGVRRLRMHLFDPPDMAVESANGYPVFPAPPREHYQAWLDLVLDDDGVGRDLTWGDGAAAAFGEVHVQVVPVVYTFVWAGRPTVVGLRGYPAWELITRLGAVNQQDPELLAWMYGPAARGV